MRCGVCVACMFRLRLAIRLLCKHPSVYCSRTSAQRTAPHRHTHSCLPGQVGSWPGLASCPRPRLYLDTAVRAAHSDVPTLPCVGGVARRIADRLMAPVAVEMMASGGEGGILRTRCRCGTWLRTRRTLPAPAPRTWDDACSGPLCDRAACCHLRLHAIILIHNPMQALPLADLPPACMPSTEPR